MLPKGRGLRDGRVAKLGKVDLEPIVCNDAILFQAWHVFADLQVYPSVRCDLAEIVLDDDLFKNYVQADLYILIPSHSGTVINVFNIQSEGMVTGGGDGAVQNSLSRRQAGAVGCGVAREFQLFANNGDTDTMRFGLVGTDAGNKSCVGDYEIGRDCGSGHSKNRVCTPWNSSAETLSEPSKVIFQACNPYVFVGATYQVTIF